MQLNTLHMIAYSSQSMPHRGGVYWTCQSSMVLSATEVAVGAWKVTSPRWFLMGKGPDTKVYTTLDGRSASRMRSLMQPHGACARDRVTGLQHNARRQPSALTAHDLQPLVVGALPIAVQDRAEFQQRHGGCQLGDNPTHLS